jgi:hypothetical protein
MYSGPYADDRPPRRHPDWEAMTPQQRAAIRAELYKGTPL